MKLYKSISIAIILLAVIPIFGQVVWTEPAFPNQTDDIKLFFDAKEGNAALSGFNGDVYAHTGVITSASTAPNDWLHVQGNWGTEDPNVLMVSEGNDVYSLSYNITDYYGISQGELVLQLAFVFRNSDGSIVGRATDGGDIFLDVFPPDDGLFVNLITPNDHSIRYQGESLNLNMEVNKAARIIIQDNGNEIFSDSTDQVQLTIIADELGLHDLEIDIQFESEEQSINLDYLVLDGNEDLEDAPIETQWGLNYATDSTFVFALMAPQKDYAFLLCPANNYTPNVDYRMVKSIDRNSYWIELPKSLFENGQNSYQYLVDDIVIADPFSVNVLDPWNDDDVNPEHMENLAPYPEGMTSGIVSNLNLEPIDYNWQSNNFEKPKKTQLVIYEMLLRDFLDSHSYNDLIDTLDYLDELGITAIELMPINEFEGNQSWGYNPNFHMAVDKYYGSIDQLRAFIDACHQRGIAVILDVVFNHAFSQSPLCQLYWNAADFRPAPSSPFLNEIARHPFNVGYDFNHESQFTKAWVKRVLNHWIEEFRFDGFRFDLSKGMTQTNSGMNSSIMAQYDQSRIDILTDYADYIWSLDQDAYVICEHFAANDEETVLSDYGMMLWANSTFQFAEAAMGYASNFSEASYKSRGWQDPHLIAYAESHDEERMGYKIKTWGNSNGDYDTKKSWIFPERIIAANMIYLSIPGPKMLWQFGETGYDFSINTCEDGSINNNCRLSPKPIRWDYLMEPTRRVIYDKLQAILHLKNSTNAFETSSFVLSGDSYTRRVLVDGSDLDILSIANFDVVTKDISYEFPYGGTWYDYFSGEAIQIDDPNQVVQFEPGEYHMFLSEPLTPPNGIFSAVAEWENNKLEIAPNPIRSGDLFEITVEQNIVIDQLWAIDSHGVSIPLGFQQTNGLLKICEANALGSTGLYIIVGTDGNSWFSQKLMIIE